MRYADAAFARRYAEAELFLDATAFERLTVWPIWGLRIEGGPVPLEPDIELDHISDAELAAALNLGVVTPRFPTTILVPDEYEIGCLRYRDRWPKQIGAPDVDDAGKQMEEANKLRAAAQDTLEQVLSLLYAAPVVVTGRLSRFEPWTRQYGIEYFSAPLVGAQPYRRLDVDADTAASIQTTWHQIRSQSNRALRLALRRLSYRSRRPRAEDEVLDIMIAAEALYLAEHSELSFRMSLRAAAMSDPRATGMTRREAYNLMRRAYDVRNKIAHGDEPGPKELQLEGKAVTLAEFVTVIESLVRHGVREALRRATTPGEKWPPDWDALVLPKD
jgi:hypothetical protein